MRFQDLFHSPPGVLFAFPSHDSWPLSVDYEYLALEDGPPIFRQDFSCPALLIVHSVPHPTFLIRGYHPLWPDFPFRSDKSTAKEHRLFRFRSPLLSESRLMSFPRATEMFQFTRFALTHSDIYGSIHVCQSPRLIAGYHVLYRDWETDRKSTRLNSSHRL